MPIERTGILEQEWIRQRVTIKMPMRTTRSIAKTAAMSWSVRGCRIMTILLHDIAHTTMGSRQHVMPGAAHFVYCDDEFDRREDRQSQPSTRPEISAVTLRCEE